MVPTSQLLLVLTAIVTFTMNQVQCHSPILLFPGFMGSRLSVKDDRSHCDTGNEYYPLWVGTQRLFSPWSDDCAVQELKLDENFYPLYTGVHVKVPYFSKVTGVESLNDHLPGTNYLHDLIDHFVDLGYTRNTDIRAAPYDWRLAADELESIRIGYYMKVRRLIELMYRENGNTPVTLVAHSMGGPVSLHFLTGYETNVITQAWKDRYIHAYVTLAGAWMGGVKAVAAPIIGMPDLSTIPIATEKLVAAARTFESTPWLMPKASVFGSSVLISTPSKQYTANDYEQLFNDIGYERGYQIFQRVSSINPNYPAPNVNTYCLYGVQVETPEKYTFQQDFSPQASTTGIEPTIQNGDGDGTVNTLSSEVCLGWQSMRHKSFEHTTYQGVDHVEIVEDDNVLQKIATIVGASERLRFLKLLKDSMKQLKKQKANKDI